MKQGELVWMSFPFSDFSGSKIRPCLIVSNDSYNAATKEVVVCAITSNPQAAEYTVPLGQADLKSGKLPIASRVKADKIAHIHKTRVLKTFATVSEKKLIEVTNQIKRLVATQ